MVTRSLTEGGAFGEAAIAYFAARAIDPELAATCGVREVAGRLAFPNRAPDGATFQRMRSLNGGCPAKVKQPSGLPLELWWPLGRPKAVDGVLVAEGESDALAVLEPLSASRYAALEVVAISAAASAVSSPRRLSSEDR